MTSDITGPAVETSSQRIGKADRNWDTLDSKILEHLVRKNVVLLKNFVPRVLVPYCANLDSAKKSSLCLSTARQGERRLDSRHKVVLSKETTLFCVV